MTAPIFIVGMPRSGSTVFYNTLAHHPDLAWISQASKKFPRSLLLTRLLMLVRRDRRPTEGHRIWRKFVKNEDDVLGRDDVTPRQSRYYRRLVDTHLRLTGRSRFLSKYPRNVLRLEYLDEIFPDALFLHLVRDARAVAASVLDMRDGHGGRAAYWGIRPPGWRSIATLDPVESAALQWTMTLEHARRSASGLSPDRYLEVRYEDFCSHPRETLRRVGDWATLEWSNDLLASATEGIDSRNYKWREAFGPEEVERIEEKTGDLLADLGYEVGVPAVIPGRTGSNGWRSR